MKATDFIQGLPGFPVHFPKPTLAFRIRLREGKLSVFVMSAAMPNHRFRPKAALRHCAEIKEVLHGANYDCGTGISCSF